MGRCWSVSKDGEYAKYIEDNFIPNYLKIEGIHDRLDALDKAGLIHHPPRGKWPGLKRYAEADQGNLPQNLILKPTGFTNYSSDDEYLGFSTQKPHALLEKFVRASSKEGDVVLDPFCGCGTTVDVAEYFNRKWIGIDITHLAIALVRYRLEDAYGEDLQPHTVIGTPKDLQSAFALAKQDRHLFEWWALGLVGARPINKKRKGADSGIDGRIIFFDDNSGEAKLAIVQVKSGKVQRSDIATLKGDMEREKAVIGLFITLKEPTGPMIKEAAVAQFYEPSQFTGHLFPRVQILTIEDLLEGKKADLPRFAADVTFRKAKRRREHIEQTKMF